MSQPSGSPPPHWMSVRLSHPSMARAQLSGPSVAWAMGSQGPTRVTPPVSWAALCLHSGVSFMGSSPPPHNPTSSPPACFLLRKNLMQSLWLLITNSSSETPSWVTGMDGLQSPWTLQESGVTRKATPLCDPQNGGAQNTLSPCCAHRKYGRK